MSNIGFAVFGSPRGIAVISNGLFKSLNLDNSLYLNDSHVVLERGEQALMVRRIPSNLNDLERKDALLIVLYENALQHGENRAGGFVGSAICFKDKMPNAEKMISGLLYLFSKMKANVDADNRFRSIDSSNWNINLPDANKEFGMFEDSKIGYSPISVPSKNKVVKLNNLEKETEPLLYNFALNSSFHSVDYLYASTSNAVVDKMKSNNFSQLSFAELFNYNRYLNLVKEKLDKENERLKFINKNAADLQKKISIDENEANRLANTITNKKKELERIDINITDAKNQLAQESNKTRQNRISQPIVNGGNNSAMSNNDADNYKALKETVSIAAGKIRKYSFIKIDKLSNSTEIDDKNYVEKYFKKMGKRKKIAFAILSVLIILIITFVSLYVFKVSELNDTKDKIALQKAASQAQSNKIENEKEKAKEFLDKLIKNQKGSVTADHREFKKLADKLLENFKNDKYERSSDEYQFIVDHKWEFWEFDYTDDLLVIRLKPNSKPYFISLNYEVKQPISPYLVWNGVDKIDELLKSYLKENNDIYENLNSEVLKDSAIIKTHFTWLIYQENGKLEDLKKGQKIKLPFLKIK